MEIGRQIEGLIAPVMHIAQSRSTADPLAIHVELKTRIRADIHQEWRGNFVQRERLSKVADVLVARRAIGGINPLSAPGSRKCIGGSGRVPGKERAE